MGYDPMYLKTLKQESLSTSNQSIVGPFQLGRPTLKSRTFNLRLYIRTCVQQSARKPVGRKYLLSETTQNYGKISESTFFLSSRDQRKSLPS